MLEYMIDNKIYPVVVTANIKYVKELKLFEKFIIKSVWSIEGNFIISKQTIFLKNNNTKITKAIIKMLLVSNERIVYDIPENLRKIIEQ